MSTCVKPANVSRRRCSGVWQTIVACWQRAWKRSTPATRSASSRVDTASHARRRRGGSSAPWKRSARECGSPSKLRMANSEALRMIPGNRGSLTERDSSDGRHAAARQKNRHDSQVFLPRSANVSYTIRRRCFHRRRHISRYAESPPQIARQEQQTLKVRALGFFCAPKSHGAGRDPGAARVFPFRVSDPCARQPPSAAFRYFSNVCSSSARRSAEGASGIACS